jgi:phosphoglycerate dehydrogenase-like enzyme
MRREPLSKVLIATGDFIRGIDALSHRFPEITFEVAGDDDIATKIVDADALMTGWIADQTMLDGARRLRWIQSFGAGVEGIVDEQFADRGILLTNGSGVMSSNMAEHVVGLMLAFARRLPALWDAQRSHTWRAGVGRDNLFELRDGTAVLVGAGRIGQDIAKRLKAFDMRVIGVRRTAGEGELPDNFDAVFPIAEIARAVAEGDHVISSLPHTEETIGLFNADLFARLSDGAYFYNLGRGTSVVQDDLIAALASGKLAGAGLDVVTPEPLPADNPLWDVPNVIITAHTAGATPRFGERVIELFGENLRRYQAGEELLNVVQPARGY